MGSLVAELAEKLSSATNNLDFDEQTLFLNTSADTVGIGTNSPGAKLDVRGSALFNEGGADADFRIEGDSQTHLFFLDASTDRIGINSATPGVQFDVVGATKITGATTQIGALTVGVDDTGHDVKFFGDTAGKYWLWDTSADGTVQVGNSQLTGTLTVGVDDTGHDVIFYGASASSNFHWDESADDLILNDARLLIEQDDAERAIYINQDGNSQAIYINNNGTASGIYLDNNNSGFAIEIENTGSTVSGLQIYSNQGNSQNSALSNFIADNTDFDQNVMQIQNDGTGYGLKIDQNGNNIALLIDGENTTSSVLQIEADALTTGHILNIYSASSSNATRNLVRIWNDNASATDTTALYVLQDSTDFALHVNKSGAAGSYVAKIESTYTGDGHNVMLVKGGANESDSKVFEVQDQNGNVDLVVLGTGKVGIGTSAPTSLLHTRTTTSMGSGVPLATFHNAYGSAAAGSDGVLIQGGASEAGAYTLKLLDYDGNNPIFFSGTGRVGINTTTPAGPLHVRGRSGEALWSYFDNYSSSEAYHAGLQWRHGTTAKWYMYNAGSTHRFYITDVGDDHGAYLTQGSGTGWTNVSDKRIKTSLSPIANAVDKLNTLQAVNFKWKYGSVENKAKNNLGLLAQEVDKVFPEAVDKAPVKNVKIIDHPTYEGEKKADPETTWGLRGNDLIPVLVKAVQELSAEVTALKNA